MERAIPMKIWRLYHDQDKYAQIAPISSFDEDGVATLHDARKSWTSNWKTPDVKEVRFKGTKWVDVNSYLIMPLCNTKTKKALICLIENSVEWLPVNVQRKNKKMEINEHFILHVTNMVDALDYENSAVRYSPYDNQSIIWIDKFSFLEEKISGQHIFKLPEMPKNHVFVSDKFRNLVIDNGIIGWEFIEEWDSEK